jgi:dihydrofolate reductase
VLSIVVARSRNGVIGRDGGLPWRLPTDLERFRELTYGSAVLMGRRTFESLPAAFRPLPGRRNIVLSSDPAYAPSDVEVMRDLGSALEACGAGGFVIGGSVTYRDTLPLVGRVYATEIDEDVDGDVFFPELSADEWRCVERSTPIRENGRRFSFCTYERRG